MFHDSSLAQTQAQAVPATAPDRPFDARLLFMLGGGVVLAFLLSDYLRSQHGSIAGQVYWGRDFINVWTGGRLARDGLVERLYDVHAYSLYQKQLFGSLGPHNYSYPPPTLFLAELVALLPYGVALGAWLVGTGALFVHAARSWWPARAGPVWLAVVSPAALVNIWAGHYGFLLGALFLYGWRLLDERPVRAGIFFGLMIIKPHLAVLIPMVLLIRGDWRAIASAAVTALLLVLLSGEAYGWATWHDYLFRTSAVQSGMIAHRDFFQLMTTSTAAALFQAGIKPGVAIACQIAMSLSAIAGVAIATRRGVATQTLAALVATGTFLVLPYAFNYDMTVVSIVVLGLLAAGGLGPVEERLALLGFLAPQLGMVLAALGLPLMPLMLAGLFWTQWRRAMASFNSDPFVQAGAGAGR